MGSLKFGPWPLWPSSHKPARDVPRTGTTLAINRPGLGMVLRLGFIGLGRPPHPTIALKRKSTNELVTAKLLSRMARRETMLRREKYHCRSPGVLGNHDRNWTRRWEVILLLKSTVQGSLTIKGTFCGFL